MSSLFRVLFGPLPKPDPAQYYGNSRKLWIHKLSREQLDQIFSHEDLIYRLTANQFAALGERLLILDETPNP